MLTPSSNTTLETVTAAMLAGLAEVSAAPPGGTGTRIIGASFGKSYASTVAADKQRTMLQADAISRFMISSLILEVRREFPTHDLFHMRRKLQHALVGRA